MMKITVKYLIRNLLISTIAVSTILLAVIYLITLIGEFKSIGKGDYGLTQVIIYGLLCLPNAYYQYFPLFMLAGCLLTLYTMNNQHEIMILQTLGLSTQRIIKVLLYTSFGIIVATSLMGEGLGVNFAKKAEIYKENSIYSHNVLITNSGMWLHLTDNFIYIQQIINRSLFYNVTIYHFDKAQHLTSILHAKRFSLVNKKWYMHEVNQSVFSGDQVTNQYYAKLPCNLKFNPNLFNFGLLDATQMTLIKLYRFIDYLRANSLAATEYQFNFWQRLFQPLSALSIILLAMPFMFGQLPARNGLRLSISIMAGFLFFILNALLGEIAIILQIPAWFAALISPLVFCALGISLFKRIIKY